MKHLATIMTLLIITALLSACSDSPANTFQGYGEGEYVYISSPIGGALKEIHVTRGQTVQQNASLFTLDQDFERAAVKKARHELQAAQNNLANLEKGKRPSEIATILARLKQAKASSALAQIEYTRRVKLISEHTISQEELDRAKSDYDQKSQQVHEIASELATARLGARSDEIRAAAAQALQAQAAMEQALWNLNQKSRMLHRPDSFSIHSTAPENGSLPANRLSAFFLRPMWKSFFSCRNNSSAHYRSVKKPK